MGVAFGLAALLDIATMVVVALLIRGQRQTPPVTADEQEAIDESVAA